MASGSPDTEACVRRAPVEGGDWIPAGSLRLRRPAHEVPEDCENLPSVGGPGFGRVLAEGWRRAPAALGGEVTGDGRRAVAAGRLGQAGVLVKLDHINYVDECLDVGPTQIEPHAHGWHIDIEEFLDLRKNTGDDRRRTHDMNTANWVPDLFMERVEADAEWTLFSPDEVPELHDLTGAAFKTAYETHEAEAAEGRIKVFRKVRALELWRRMLTMLFETAHPWVTFKDPCNIRSPQGHAGVVHSSNLCTEITLNTSDDEVAVCNLGSLNLAAHVTPEGLDEDRLARTVRTAVRMLDNVIDINFYTIPEARRSNLRHRPVGLGLMGFQDALHALRLPYASDAAVAFADESMEAISFHAISASVDLAGERGCYPSFEGSLWSKGILPIDSLELLADARGGLDLDRGSRLDWEGCASA